MMLARFFVLILISMMGLSAQAADVSGKPECGSFFEKQASKPGQISSSANVYENLIKFFITKSGKNSDWLMARVLNSELPINPFVGVHDSVALQLVGPAMKVTSELSAQDWQQVKASLQALIKKSQVEEADTAEKEAETAPVFSPYVVAEASIGWSSYSSPSWQVIGGRIFVAVGSDDTNVYLFELVNEKLELVEKIAAAGKVISSPQWRVVDRQVYLAFTSSHYLYLYNFSENGLVENSKVMVSEDFFEADATPIWHTVNGRTLIAAGSGSKPPSGMGDISVFELIDGKLIKLDTQRTVGTIDKQVEWLTHKGKTYLALGTSEDGLYVYDFTSAGLGLVDRAILGQSTVGTPAWQVVDGRVYLAVGVTDKKVYFYELAEGELQFRQEFEGMGSFTAQPHWYKIDGKVYVTVGSLDYAQHFFELKDGQFTRNGYGKVAGQIFSKAPLQVIDGRNYLAVGAYSNRLNIFELHEGKPHITSTVAVSNWIFASPSWLSRGNHAYIAISTRGGHLQIIDTHKTLEKGGRK